MLATSAGTPPAPDFVAGHLRSRKGLQAVARVKSTSVHIDLG